MLSWLSPVCKKALDSLIILSAMPTIRESPTQPFPQIAVRRPFSLRQNGALRGPRYAARGAGALMK